MAATAEGFRSTSPEQIRSLGGRRWEIKCDVGMRPAQLPRVDVPMRFDDDDFGDSGIWIRLPEDLVMRLLNFAGRNETEEGEDMTPTEILELLIYTYNHGPPTSDEFAAHMARIGGS